MIFSLTKHPSLARARCLPVGPPERVLRPYQRGARCDSAPRAAPRRDQTFHAAIRAACIESRRFRLTRHLPQGRLVSERCPAEAGPLSPESQVSHCLWTLIRYLFECRMHSKADSVLFCRPMSDACAPPIKECKNMSRKLIGFSVSPKVRGRPRFSTRHFEHPDPYARSFNPLFRFTSCLQKGLGFHGSARGNVDVVGAI